jgi:hypothetical protein
MTRGTTSKYNTHFLRSSQEGVEPNKHVLWQQSDLLVGASADVVCAIREDFQNIKHFPSITLQETLVSQWARGALLLDGSQMAFEDFFAHIFQQGRRLLDFLLLLLLETLFVFLFLRVHSAFALQLFLLLSSFQSLN